MNKGIYGFFGEYRFLSNFYACDILYEGIKYPSVEHAYQAAKTTSTRIRKRIAKIELAGAAKAFGQHMQIIANWEEKKLNVMNLLVLTKFTCYKELREKIMNTGNLHLEETNTWGDKYWGIFEGNGKNHLGEILMKVREYLIRMEKYGKKEDVVKWEL